MPERPNTTRTKQVIAAWAAVQDLSEIMLDTPLDRLREGARPQLRRRLNEEFSGEGTFPIVVSKDWKDQQIKRVSDVRDVVDKKIPDGT